MALCGYVSADGSWREGVMLRICVAVYAWRVELVTSVYMYNVHVNALFGKPDVNVAGVTGKLYT
jgi:hypothetical protein